MLLRAYLPVTFIVTCHLTLVSRVSAADNDEAKLSAEESKVLAEETKLEDLLAEESKLEELIMADILHPELSDYVEDELLLPLLLR